MKQQELNFNQQATTDEMIMARCKSLTGAIDYCIEVSPYERQEVAFRMKIDSGHLNRMLNPNDNMNFPPDRIDELMEICGNLIPLRFQALKRRHGIHRLRSSVEEENEVLRAMLREKEQKESAIMGFLEKAKVSLNFGG